ncbi:helix-turn-helix transcriptional regulator [Halapricum sp. CBA1109]|uniref:ArsR/SmtB family transcription factor n=1 Tax=Halapricum sp. CBA1109 TaxID=2668068 RepID=UPI0018D1FBC4|nr:metalloregulator ArsR/SmtB family transcription factor [Halapricum sp. CBA1109]
MSQSDRLRRLVADELGDCCAEDVKHRQEQLRELKASTPMADATDHVSVLSTLSDDTRYRLTRLIASGGERCVCELEVLVDVSESAVSHALSDLVEVGLLTRRKEGKWRYYRTTDRAEAVLAALDETGGEQ